MLYYIILHVHIQIESTLNQSSYKERGARTTTQATTAQEDNCPGRTTAQIVVCLAVVTWAVVGASRKGPSRSIR